jgi:hypothetical protein
MRVARSLVLAAGVLLAAAPHAFADVTLFLGSTTTPSARQARGFAIGGGILVLGFEFEYSDTREDAEDGAPSLRTGMGNILVQTPVAIGGFQPYFTTGFGGYRESINERSETQLGGNAGGGVKMNLAGPLRVRFDYRVFRLRGEPLHDVVHRVYVGANLNF